MKFLLDRDVYALTQRFLREQGNIFVTCDRGYGNFVFVHGTGSGVIYMRMLRSAMNEVHAELIKCLKHTAKRNWKIICSGREKLPPHSKDRVKPLTRFRLKTGLVFYPVSLRAEGCGRIRYLNISYIDKRISNELGCSTNKSTA